MRRFSSHSMPSEPSSLTPADSTETVTRPIVLRASSSDWTMSVRPSVVVATVIVSSPACALLDGPSSGPAASRLTEMESWSRLPAVVLKVTSQSHSWLPSVADDATSTS